MTLLHELSKIDRRAALLYNREIRLLKKRGKLNFDHDENLPEIPEDLPDLIDSFSWGRHAMGMIFGRRF